MAPPIMAPAFIVLLLSERLYHLEWTSYLPWLWGVMNIWTYGGDVDGRGRVCFVSLAFVYQVIKLL